MLKMPKILETRPKILRLWFVPTRSRSKQSNESAVDTIMCAPGIRGFGLENAQRVDVVETLQTHKSSKEREITWIPRRSIIAERSWSATSRDEQYQKRMQEPAYTQSGMKYFDRVALEGRVT